MITLRKSGERGHVVQDGIEKWKTFGDQTSPDPLHGGFRTLQFLDEDGLAPGAEFPQKCLNDTELLTYVWKGAMIQETTGDGVRRFLEMGEWSHSHLRSGEVQRIINGSPTEGARVFHCHFTPDRSRLKTSAAQKRFPLAERRGTLRLILSPDGRDGSLRCRQDVLVYSSVLDPGRHVIHELVKDRAAWIHVVSGSVQWTGGVFGEGDGASYVNEPAVSLTALAPSEILLFDLAQQ